MRPTHIWIIAGTLGALIGAAFTGYLTGNNPPTSSLAGVNQTEPVSRDPKMVTPAVSIGDNRTQDSMAVQRDGLPISSTKTETPSAAPPPNTAGLKKPDPAEEEAMVQVLTSRLHDPSMTLADIMQSEEMLKLSDETRERVVAKMVGMLNRGELDARTFMPGGR